MSKENQKRKKKIDVYAKYSGIVFQMGIIIAGGAYGGVLLDRKSSREFPLYTVVFSLLAVFIAIYLVIKQVINDNEKEDN